MELKTFEIKGKFLEAAKKTIRYSPHYEVIVALGKDATGHFVTDEDGIKWLKANGFIN